MFLNTVHHVAIIVSDYERSRDFLSINLVLKSLGKIIVPSVMIIS